SGADALPLVRPGDGALRRARCEKRGCSPPRFSWNQRMNNALLDPQSLTQSQQIGRSIVEEVGRVFIGNPALCEALLLGLLSRGHVLLEGVPGVAKTTLCKAFAQVLGCQFRRVQFTPDLLPSDITGTYILDPRSKDFVLREGPIFAQIILGDEINRAPPKTQ